jgi:hypothetical protein
MIDVEAEGQALAERSGELIAMLDSSHPVVGPPPAELDESRRLGRAAHEARKRVAEAVARGRDPGCPLGPPAPVRRVRTDPRTGRDLDPLGGRQAVTSELVAYWEHRRDCVAPAVEAQYRSPAEAMPYQEPLAAAARGHLSVLQGRQSRGEGAEELHRALRGYNESYESLRSNALDSQGIAREASERLASLRRIAAALELGEDKLEGFIAAAVASSGDFPLIDPESGRPLSPAGATSDRPVEVTASAPYGRRGR